MRKNNSVDYDVLPNERITIKVTPINFGSSAPAVVAVLDGDEMANVGSPDAPVYRFTVSKPVGLAHTVLMEFTFFDDAPDNAFYRVAISGQNDVGCPCGFEIAVTDEVKEAGIGFNVVAPQGIAGGRKGPQR